MSSSLPTLRVQERWGGVVDLLIARGLWLSTMQGRAGQAGKHLIEVQSPHRERRLPRWCWCCVLGPKSLVPTQQNLEMMIGQGRPRDEMGTDETRRSLPAGCVNERRSRGIIGVQEKECGISLCDFLGAEGPFSRVVLNCPQKSKVDVMA